MKKKVPLYIELQWYYYFSLVRLKYLLSIFLTDFKPVLSLRFQSQYFEVIKEFHTFFIYIWSTEPTLIFWTPGKKYTCQCLSTIQFQPQ